MQSYTHGDHFECLIRKYHQWAIQLRWLIRTLLSPTASSTSFRFSPRNDRVYSHYDRPKPVWLDVLLYTGLRRGDAVRLGRQHIREGLATLKTEKIDTVVTLPILPVLAETLAAGPCGDMTFIVGKSAAKIVCGGGRSRSPNRLCSQIPC